MVNKLTKATLKYETELDHYIEKYFGLPKVKLDLIGEGTSKIFKAGLILNLGQRGLIRDLFLVGGDFNWYDGFFQIISFKGDKLTVESMDSGIISDLDISRSTCSEDLYKKGRNFYGLIKLDLSQGKGISYLYDQEILDNIEMSRISLIFQGNYHISSINLFFEEVVMSRITRKFLEPVERLISENEDYIMARYSLEDMSMATMFLTNMTKIAILEPKATSIYHLDLEDYLLKQVGDGFFLVEDSIENTLAFLQDIYSGEKYKSEDLKNFYKSLQDLSDRIFIYKSYQNEVHPPTSLKLIEALENEISRDNFPNIDLFKIAFYYEGLKDLYEIKVSPKKKRITAKTAREFFDNLYGSHDLATDRDYDLLEFVNSFFYGNGYIDYIEEDLVFSSQIASFMSPDPYILMANILTRLFRPKVFEKYIGKKNIDYQDLVLKLEKAITDQDFSTVLGLKGGQEALDIMETLGLVEAYGQNYKLTILSQAYRTSSLGKENVGKILRFR